MKSIGIIIAGLLVAPPALADDIVIGSPLALTGPYASLGTHEAAGVKMAFDEINTKGGIKGVKIKLVQEDTASDKNQAIALVNRMAVSDKALMIVGPSTSIESLAAAPEANDLKIPMYAFSLSTQLRAPGKWALNGPALPAASVPILIKYGIDTMKIKRIGIVSVRNNEAFVNEATIARDMLKKAGVEIAVDDTIAGNETDFTALATKLASANLDSLATFMYAEPGANILIQARQAGLPEKTKLLMPTAMAEPTYVKIGGSAVDGAVVVADWFIGRDSELNKNFVANFKKRTGNDPDNWDAMGYAMANVAAKAIEAAGPNPTREAVLSKLELTKDEPTILGDGKYSFTADRVPDYGAVLLTIKNGTFILVQ